MKTIFRLGTLLLALTFMVSCQGDDITTNFGDDENVVIKFASTTIFEVIDEIGVQNPDLLIQTIESIGDRYMPLPSGGKAYPWMYLVENYGKKYIYLIDTLSSSMSNSYFFFTLSGDLVGPNEITMLSGQRSTLSWPVVIRE